MSRSMPAWQYSRKPRDRRLYKRAIDAFHGKPPRMFWSMIRGGGWRPSSRAPRAAVLEVLARAGLTMVFVEHPDKPWKTRGQLDEVAP